MAKGKGRYGLTESDIKRFQVSCDRKDCDGRACMVMHSWGGYYECRACGRKFGYTDGRGSPVYKAEYDALAERGRNKPARGAGMSCPAEEDEMAKAKKTGKSAAKATKKGEVKKTVVRTPEDRAKANPVGVAAALIATSNSTDEEVTKKVIALFPDAPAIYQNGSGVKGIRKALLVDEPRFAWVKELNGYKKPQPSAPSTVEKKTAPKPKAASKAAPKAKATPKAKAKAKK